MQYLWEIFSQGEMTKIHCVGSYFVCAHSCLIYYRTLFMVMQVTALHTHEVSHTERRPYMCDVCGKAFKWSKNLRQHKSVHIGTGSIANNKMKIKAKHQPCQCEVCGKQLSGRSSLRQHIANIHNGEARKQKKSTVCPVCGKMLSSSGVSFFFFTYVCSLLVREIIVNDTFISIGFGQTHKSYSWR